MAAYAMALHNVTLAGPTLFGPVIHKVAEIAGQSLLASRNKYYILLIITVTYLLYHVILLVSTSHWLY